MAARQASRGPGGKGKQQQGKGPRLSQRDPMVGGGKSMNPLHGDPETMGVQGGRRTIVSTLWGRGGKGAAAARKAKGGSTAEKGSEKQQTAGKGKPAGKGGRGAPPAEGHRNYWETLRCKERNQALSKKEASQSASRGVVWKPL